MKTPHLRKGTKKCWRKTKQMWPAEKMSQQILETNFPSFRGSIAAKSVPFNKAYEDYKERIDIAYDVVASQGLDSYVKPDNYKNCLYVIGGGNFTKNALGNMVDWSQESEEYYNMITTKLPVKETIITFNGDSFQSNSPFTDLIKRLMDGGYRIESVRDATGKAFGGGNKAINSWKDVGANLSNSHMVFAGNKEDDKKEFNADRATHVLAFAVKVKTDGQQQTTGLNDLIQVLNKTTLSLGDHIFSKEKVVDEESKLTVVYTDLIEKKNQSKSS